MKLTVKTGGSTLALAVAMFVTQAQSAAAASLAPAPEAPSAAVADAAAPAPDAAPAPAAEPVPQGDIVVVGSQIKGAKTTGALPVTVMGADDIAAVGAPASADQLFRALPEASPVGFTGLPSGAGQNAPRGDVASVSMRGLTVGYTLVELDGRRLVAHPTTTNINGAPQVAYNVNTIPVGGIERVEVLRDGAAALYGSDAIAGVINNVLNDKFQGGNIEATYGFAEGTHMKEGTLNASYGTDFAHGKGHIALFGTYYARSAEYAEDEPYLSTVDLRSFISPTDPTASALAWDGRPSQSVWGQFSVPTGFGLPTGGVSAGGAPVTSAAGVMSVVPCADGGAGLTVTGTAGICYRNAAITAQTADRVTYANIPQAFPNQITAVPSVRRGNIFLLGHYDLTPDIQLYTELNYYTAYTTQFDQAAQIVSAFPITVAANAYWNPLNPASPNFIKGANVPAGGLPLTIQSLTPNENGPREVDVRNTEYRLLAGLRGKLGNWNWDSGLLYSAAMVRDTSDALDMQAFQAAVNKTTADAYNPFSGGNPFNPSGVDTSLSNAATSASFITKGVRINKTSLALWDFKVSNAHLIHLWAGDVGLASGIEVRHETYSDNRDAHQDGTITFTDTVTGLHLGTDFAMSSPRPDVSGARTVFSAYGELAIPLVDPDMHIPLMRSVDVQVAGRYEHYSDVGDVAKPKVAVSWDVVSSLRLRGSYSQGFHAPTLEELHIAPSGLTSSGVLDPVRCEADLRLKRITSFAQCNDRYALSVVTGGNPNLKPETSTDYSVGAVFEPKFIPPSWGRFVFTVDRFWLHMDNVISSLSTDTQMQLDYLRRLQGSTNTAVQRNPVTADDTAFFAGSGIAPVGTPLIVSSLYQNVQPLDVQGMDFSFTYTSPKTSVGRFKFSVNASEMIKYYQSALIQQQELIDAQNAGTINKGLSVGATTGNLVGQGSLPKWRGTATLTWNLGDVTVGAFAQYTGHVQQTSINVNGILYDLPAQTTVNLYVTYQPHAGLFKDTKFTVGARNLTGESPPLYTASGGQLGGFNGSLYPSYNRYWYLTVGRKF